MADPMPSTWRALQLGDVVTLSRGIDLPVQSRLDGLYPVIGSSGIVGYHSAMAAHGPGVLVGRSGSVGEVRYVEEDYWPLNTTLWVTDFHGNDPLFVSFFLQHLELGRFTAGVSVPTLNRNILHRIEVQLPSVAEQRTIAHILHTVQEATDVRRRELALEREHKAALMEYLLTHGTRREPLEMTQFGEIPKSWKLCQLRELVRANITDGTHKTPTYVADGVPFITAKDIIANRIVFDCCSHISQAEHLVLSKRVRPERGDVLLTKVGTVGNAALVEDSIEFSIFVQVALIKPKQDLLYPRFLLYSLQSERGQSDLRNKSALSTMRFIGTQKIALLRIALPSFQEQLEISRALEASDSKVAALVREIALLDELFRSMLEELMTGRLSAIPLIEEHQPQ